MKVERLVKSDHDFKNFEIKLNTKINWIHFHDVFAQLSCLLNQILKYGNVKCARNLEKMIEEGTDLFFFWKYTIYVSDIEITVNP